MAALRNLSGGRIISHRLSTALFAHSDAIRIFYVRKYDGVRSRRPRSLRCGSAAACLLGLRVRIPPGHGYLHLVSVVCCQVEVSASDQSLIYTSPAEYDVC